MVRRTSKSYCTVSPRLLVRVSVAYKLSREEGARLFPAFNPPCMAHQIIMIMCVERERERERAVIQGKKGSVVQALLFPYIHEEIHHLLHQEKSTPSDVRSRRKNRNSTFEERSGSIQRGEQGEGRACCFQGARRKSHSNCKRVGQPQ